MKYFFVAILFLITSLRGFGDEPKEIEGSRYYLGGALSVIPGYGLGHLAQGRFSER